MLSGIFRWRFYLLISNLQRIFHVIVECSVIVLPSQLHKASTTVWCISLVLLIIFTFGLSWHINVLSKGSSFVRLNKTLGQKVSDFGLRSNVVTVTYLIQSRNVG